jgi:hypothetical protein
MSDTPQFLWLRVAFFLGVIVSGLMLRRFGLDAGLPIVVVKYGGSLLWGTMVYWLVAIIVNVRCRLCIAFIAALVAAAVELFRLYHNPWLDAFRLTTAGALLLGRVFSFWNLLAYGVGVSGGLTVDLLLQELGCLRSRDDNGAPIER